MQPRARIVFAASSKALSRNIVSREFSATPTEGAFPKYAFPVHPDIERDFDFLHRCMMSARVVVLAVI